MQEKDEGYIWLAILDSSVYLEAGGWKEAGGRSGLTSPQGSSWGGRRKATSS